MTLNLSKIGELVAALVALLSPRGDTPAPTARPAALPVPAADLASAAPKVKPYPASMNDIDMAARTLFGEARGEGWQGLVAVAWVIRNRAELSAAQEKRTGKALWWGGPDLLSVVRKDWQFSCWNADDPNCEKLRQLDELDPTFAQCRRVVEAVLTGMEPDPTNGATHYFAPRAVKSPPLWAKGKTPVAVVGRHEFYIAR